MNNIKSMNINNLQKLNTKVAKKAKNREDLLPLW